MTPQAMRAPAFPVVLLSSCPPTPRSSGSACTTKVRPTMLLGPRNEIWESWMQTCNTDLYNCIYYINRKSNQYIYSNRLQVTSNWIVIFKFNKSVKSVCIVNLWRISQGLRMLLRKACEKLNSCSFKMILQCFTLQYNSYPDMSQLTTFHTFWSAINSLYYVINFIQQYIIN